MIGLTISHYTITEKLGEGGMGEVYRAHDAQLDREVAIKVLPEAFTADPERLARFEREARLLAALDHPRIAGIYGLEEIEGQRFLIMQLAEGEDLQERLARGPLPVADAMKIALQVTEALEAAHAKGIIHRDLKPANVKVDSTGQVKVLDFGLAKALEGEGGEGSAPSLTASPTLTAQMTGAGVLLGTAAYMSPEQARGEPADKRADLWALGVLLWEMLTGKRLFTGKTLSDTLAGVLRDEPSFEALPTDLPAPLRRLLRRCLEREPHERLPDAASARLELEDALAGRIEVDGPMAPAPRTVSSWRRSLPWALFGAAALGLVVILIGLWPRASAPTPPIRLQTEIADEPLDTSLGSSVVLSPDGSRIAYVTDNGSTGTLFVRSFERLESTSIATGTAGARPYHPFFSPDGHWLGFVTSTELKKVPITGGTPITLCDVNRSRGASWGPDGSILFAPGALTGLATVPATGGEPRELTSLDEERNEISHRWPHFLPDGTAAIFTVGFQGMSSADEASVEAVTIATGERTVLIQGGYYGQYVPTGHLVFGREGTLFAVRFDTTTLELRGSPAPIVEGVFGGGGPGGAQYSFSEDGTLAYVAGEIGVEEYPVVSVDRQGQMTTVWDAPAAYASPVFSPSGDRLAFSVLRGDNWDVWIYDLARQVATRLTFADGYDADPLWSPDGTHIYFTSDRDGVESLYKKPADGSADAVRLTESELNFYPCTIAPDESVIVGETLADGVDLTVFSIQEGGEPVTFLASSFMERDPDFSPNGRWIAYSSNESGRYEIYVRPFPAAGGRWQVSDGGGRWPSWSRDGRELFYRTDDGIMVADVETEGPTFSVGRPRPLIQGDFQGGFSGISVGGFIFQDYDVAPDGERLVMFPDESRDNELRSLTLVFHWFGELRQTLPAP